MASRNRPSGICKVQTDKILISANVQREIDSFIKTAPKRQVEWSADMKEVLRKYYNHMSGQAMTDLLNKVFPEKTFSRALVVGQAYRLGISVPGRRR